MIRAKEPKSKKKIKIAFIFQQQKMTMATFKTNFTLTYEFIIRLSMQISFEELILYSKLQKCATLTNLHINKCEKLL